VVRGRREPSGGRAEDWPPASTRGPVDLTDDHGDRLLLLAAFVELPDLVAMLTRGSSQSVTVRR
jgi:hypothetical protein